MGVLTLLKEQNGTLHELHNKVADLRTAASRIGEFATQLQQVEGDITDAQDIAKKIVSAGTGIGEIQKALADIKAKAVHEQYSMGLAKAKIDELVPTAEAGAGVEMAWVSVLAPNLPSSSRKCRNKGQHGADF